MQATLTIQRLETPPPMTGQWGGPGWHDIAPLSIAHFHPRSSLHRPMAEAKIACSGEGLHLLFRVQDRFVRCVQQGFQAPVYKDTCAEFFVRPNGTGGYFNFEMNAGGSLLATFIEDWTRTPEGFATFTRLDAKWDAAIPRFHSLPERIDPELRRPTLWSLQYTIPWDLFGAYRALGRPEAGTTWSGNFYKCGDETSHPHWAAWSPIGESLNFHQPDKFGSLRFA